MRRILSVIVITGVLGIGTLTGCSRSVSVAEERALERFTEHLSRTLTPSVAITRFGPPFAETGSGLRILRYRLAGTDELWLGFPGEAPILYAKVQHADGSFRDLPLR